MGCDWIITDGEYKIDSIFRMCSGNFSDIWDKYGFNRNVIHGHSCEVVIDYLSGVMKRMADNGVELMSFNQVQSETSRNPSWMWGTDGKNHLDNHVREQAVHYQLNCFVELAKKYKGQSYYWVGDQTNYVGPYTYDDGRVEVGHNVEF